LKPALKAGLALVALNAAVFAPVRYHDFVNWDDPDYVTANAPVAAGLTGDGVAWAFTHAHSANWHPLTWLSHMLDAQLFGMSAGAHHVTSLVLHMASTLLLFVVLHGMTGALGRSALVAALFAVHPLHVESVAWIAERKDVLSTLFFMSTLWAYQRYVQHPGRGRYLAVVLLFALGLMSKPMLVTLPFVLLLLDLWPLGRLSASTWRPRVIEKLPLLALTVMSCVATFLVQQKDDAITGFEQLPLGPRVQNAVHAYVGYIVQMLWPTRLAVVYPYPSPSAILVTLAAAAALIGLSALAVRAVPQRPYLAVGWLWYLGMLVPVIGLVQIGSQTMADRYTYLPLIGLFIVLAWGGAELLAAWPRLSTSLGVAAVLTCAILARQQVAHWRDSESLWTHALAVTTGTARAHNNLANAVADKGRVDEAIAHYEEALRLRPEFAEAHNNLGNALARQDRKAEAIEHYRTALRLRPDYAMAHNGLASALDDTGHTDEAIDHYREALRLSPGFAEVHNNLGAALLGRGQIDEALSEFLAAVRLNPNNAYVRVNAAMLLARRGHTAEAVQQLEAALQIDPENTRARRMLDDLRRKGPAPTGP